LSLLLLVGGVGGYIGGTTAVRVVDDGATRTVRTYAHTVKGLLQQAGITLGRHDTVAPATSSEIAPEARVVVARGRPVTLTLDGVTKTRWVTARTVGGLVGDLKLDGAKLRVSTDRATNIPRDGMALTIRTQKHLTLVHDGEKSTLTTYAATPAELYREAHLALTGRDESKPELHATLAGAHTVRLIRVKVKPKHETVDVDPPVKTEKQDDWMVDQQATVDAGRKGRAEQDVEYIYRDGKFSERKVITSKTLVEPKPALVRKGTQPYPKDDTGLNWEALADCESHGNPKSVSSNGLYHGLYQFNVSMWQRMGGIGLPSEATPREQTYRAILLYKRSGADQWPACGPRLFS